MNNPKMSRTYGEEVKGHLEKRRLQNERCKDKTQIN